MKFMDGFAWMSQILLFLTLGLLVNPGELIEVLVPALVISAFLIFVGRPLTVFLTLIPFRKVGFKDKLYVSWVGLRGACPLSLPFFRSLRVCLTQDGSLTWCL